MKQLKILDTYHSEGSKKRGRLMADFVNVIAIVGSSASVISICVNIVQAFVYRRNKKEHRAMAQEEFNSYYNVARACARARKLAVGTPVEEYKEALQYIRGIADVRRGGIAAFSNQMLGFMPTYEHPMYPGGTPCADVAAGTPPDEL